MPAGLDRADGPTTRSEGFIAAVASPLAKRGARLKPPSLTQQLSFSLLSEHPIGLEHVLLLPRVAGPRERSWKLDSLRRELGLPRSPRSAAFDASPPTGALVAGTVGGGGVEMTTLWGGDARRPLDRRSPSVGRSRLVRRLEPGASVPGAASAPGTPSPRWPGSVFVGVCTQASRA
jgi:hypothetical protein